MRASLIGIIISILSPVLFAKSLLIPHPELDPKEYEYQLGANDGLITYVEFYQSQSRAEAREIAEEFAQARMAELSGDHARAKTSFQNVARLYPKLRQMNESLERIVSGALQKLVKSSASSTEKSYWQQELARLEHLLQIDSPKPVAPSLISGDLVTPRIWKPSDQLKDFDRVIINGVSYPITTNLKISLIPGRFRVTALSNRYAPQSIEADSESLFEWKPEIQSFLGGHCSEPLLQFNGGSEIRVEALYSKDCRVAFLGTQIQRQVDGGGFVQDYSQPLTAEKELALPSSTPSGQIKKSWLLWGAVAVVGGLVMHHQLKNKDISVEWPSTGSR